MASYTKATTSGATSAPSRATNANGFADPAVAQAQAAQASAVANSPKTGSSTQQTSSGATSPDANLRGFADPALANVQAQQTSRGTTSPDANLRGFADPALANVPTQQTGGGGAGGTGAGGTSGGRGVNRIMESQVLETGPSQYTDLGPGAPDANAGTGEADKGYDLQEIWKQLQASGEKGSLANRGGGGGGTVNVDLGARTEVPKAPDLKPYLDAWQRAAQQQQQAKIDYATEQAVLELQRAQEDAQKEFRTNQEQIDAAEAYAKDNQALYAEARGDKGGIGAAQYDSIMNTAAINRQSVKDAQTKLATDTWRQIADLRAQGEFEKADAVLEITQTYLSNLMSLEQWAANYGLSAAQFAESIREWEANFQMSVGELMGNYGGQQTLAARNADRSYALDEQTLALNTLNADRNFALNEANVTGYYNGTPTYAREKTEQSEAKSMVDALLSVGVMPSEEQIKASGYTPEQVQAVLIAQQAKRTGGGGSGGSPRVTDMNAYAIMAAAGAKTEGEAYQALRDAGYKDTEAKTFAGYYADDLKKGTLRASGDLNDLFAKAQANGGKAYLTSANLKGTPWENYDAKEFQAQYDEWLKSGNNPAPVKNSEISAAAKGWLNGLRNAQASNTWKAETLEKEVDSGALTEREAKWIAENLGLI